MKIAKRFSQEDSYVLDKLSASLFDPTLLRRAEEAPDPGKKIRSVATITPFPI